jgi:adenine-specific DNA-methyltransferase
MNQLPEKIKIETDSPSAAIQEALRKLIPGALGADGTIDAQVLAELSGLEVSGIKGGPEGFGLLWAGKSTAVKALKMTSRATLVPECTDLKSWANSKNAFIEGDNLEALKLLQKPYNDQVKLIYIDPPYNTGNDFVYHDDFSQSLRHYLEVTGQIDSEGNRLQANTETSGRKHSNWLKMMYPRLFLARNLLCEDGVICVSIDDHEINNLKLLMNEIFGEENHLATLIWNKQHSQQQGLFKKYHEYVVIYARQSSLLSNITGGEGLIEAGALKKVSRANPASEFEFPAGVRFEARDGTEYTGVFGDSEKVQVVRGVLKSENGRTTQPVTLSAGWTQKNQMKSWFSGLETVDSKGQVVKEFFFNSAGKLKCVKERSKITPPTILPSYGMVSAQTEYLDSLLGGHVFDNPKPVSMIKDFVEWFTNPGDLVLDFFAGSGTTAEACLQFEADGQGRRFILVNIAEQILEHKDEAKRLGLAVVSDITRLRISKVLEKLSLPADGVRFYSLGQSAFIRVEEDEEDGLFNLVSQTLSADANDCWIASEILTRTGVRMDEDWTVISSQSHAAVISGGVLVSLSREIDSGWLDKVCEFGPSTVIFLEDAFKANDPIKTNAHFKFKQANITMKTI